jgi:hypothetical protein
MVISIYSVLFSSLFVLANLTLSEVYMHSFSKCISINSFQFFLLPFGVSELNKKDIVVVSCGVSKKNMVLGSSNK